MEAEALVTSLRNQLVDLLGRDTVITEPRDHEPYCRDWHGDMTSAAVAVLRPRDTGEVAAVVRACQTLDLDIVAQGGNTGLVLGALPDRPERQVVLSLERMRHIRSIDEADFSAIVEAGCVLEELKLRLEERGLFFPLTLGAQGSCRIGGNVSTNAGGVNVLRYGMTRELVLGLEVVLADGSVWDGLSTLRKDNRGIDLKQLFIGAEGTLGIITAVAIKLSPLPERIETALLGVGDLHTAIALYRHARRACCDLISAFEFMPPSAFTLAREAQPGLPLPIATDYPAYVLIEISSSGLIDAKQLMEGLLEQAMEESLVLDGVIATSQAQARQLWAIREGMNEGQALRGPHLRTDISVPLSRLAEFVAEIGAELDDALPQCLAVAYGHVGDGNVHLNVLPPAGATLAERHALIARAKKMINFRVDHYHGSFSAEHGIGRLKRDEFEHWISPVQRRLLEALKRAIDPEYRLNPGCQLPPITAR